jgi:hypothetical protein
LLDVSKGILGDDQLTAKFFLQYGTTIANHSIGKLLPEERRRLSQEAYVLWNEAPEYEIGQSQAQDASNLKHWLKEGNDNFRLALRARAANMQKESSKTLSIK